MMLKRFQFSSLDNEIILEVSKYDSHYRSCLGVLTEPLCDKAAVKAGAAVSWISMIFLVTLHIVCNLVILGILFGILVFHLAEEPVT